MVKPYDGKVPDPKKKHHTGKGQGKPFKKYQKTPYGDKSSSKEKPVRDKHSSQGALTHRPFDKMKRQNSDGHNRDKRDNNTNRDYGKKTGYKNSSYKKSNSISTYKKPKNHK